MGRLFWKFFFFILLAQLAATIGIGSTIWLKNQMQEKAGDGFDHSPPAAFQVQSAAATLQYGGPAALQHLLEKTGPHQVYAINEHGEEILGRSVTPAMRAHARQMLQQQEDAAKLSSARPGHHPQVVQQASAADGHLYTLFSPAPEHEPGRQNHPHDASDERLHGQDRPPPPHGERFHPLTPFIPIVAATLASLIFAGLLARYFSKPIRNLRNAFEAAAGGDLERRIDPDMDGRRDELADLGRDFDRMADRLRTSMENQRRLLHDVSHELRSPLARLQAAIGLARQQPEKAEQSMERIERESERMDKLVGELLTLSRLEAGNVGVDEEVNIGELLTDIVNDAQFEAEANGRSVNLSGHCMADMRGQAELLHRAIENVIRNAVKHTEKGSTVTVDTRLDAAGDCLRLSILDQGPGVPEAELEAIFAPFFRGSRTDKNTDGYGLGLAIAQRVIHAHRGTIRARNCIGRGLCIDIVLPVLPGGQAG